MAERQGGSDSSDGWRGARSSLTREPHVHLLELHGLSRTNSAELLCGLLGRKVPEQLVSHAYAISAGNPFYLREVVRALDRAPASDVELPATLAGVVEQRLEQLTPRTRELLRASSILGEEFSIAIAARLLGRSVFGCLPDIDEAISAGVLSAAAGDRVRSRTHWFVRPWSPGCRCETGSACTAGRCGQSSSSTPMPCVAISPTLRGTLPPPRWAVIDDQQRSGHAAPATRRCARWRSRKLVDRAAAEHRSGRLDTARATCGEAIRIARRTGDHQLLAQAALALEPAGDRAMDRDILDWCRDALEVPGATPSLRGRLLARRTEALVHCGEWNDAVATSRAALSVADEGQDTDALVAALRAPSIGLQWTRPGR